MESVSTSLIELLLLQTVSLMITAFLIPKFTVSGPLGALLAVIVLFLLNGTLWNAKLFFAVPDSFTVKAAVVLIANGLLFWIVVKILPGIEVYGFWPAFIAPVVFSITNLFVVHYGRQVNWNELFQQATVAVTDVRDDLLKEQNPTLPQRTP
jgi:putative membrane protein